MKTTISIVALSLILISSLFGDEQDIQLSIQPDEAKKGSYQIVIGKIEQTETNTKPTKTKDQ